MTHLLWFFLFFSQVAETRSEPLVGLDSSKKLKQFMVEKWTTQEGLPGNTLLRVLQTRDGFLWLSSYQGLIRFDGVTFTHFNRANTPVFKTNTINNLAEGQDGGCRGLTPFPGRIWRDAGV